MRHFNILPFIKNNHQKYTQIYTKFVRMTMKINTVINNGTELILTGHWTQKQQSLQSLQLTIEQIPRYTTFGVITKAQ